MEIIRGTYEFMLDVGVEHRTYTRCLVCLGDKSFVHFLYKVLIISFRVDPRHY